MRLPVSRQRLYELAFLAALLVGLVAVSLGAPVLFAGVIGA